MNAKLKDLRIGQTVFVHVGQDYVGADENGWLSVKVSRLIGDCAPNHGHELVEVASCCQPLRVLRRRPDAVGALSDVAAEIEWVPGDLDDLDSLLAAAKRSSPARLSGSYGQSISLLASRGSGMGKRAPIRWRRQPSRPETGRMHSRTSLSWATFVPHTRSSDNKQVPSEP